MLYAVIMAGGSGTRLWPLSRQGQPKQALQLVGDRTMFQHAVERLAPLFSPDKIFVVTNGAVADVLRPQVPALPADNFIVEPEGRDSAPAAGLAAARHLARDSEATMVILTADHHIADTEQFRAALGAAAEAAGDGTIVTLGVRPNLPATGYGYIQLGDPLTIISGFRIYRAAGFREKPNRETAERFLQDGRYVWNSGMFVWRADRLMSELKRQLPVLWQVLDQAALLSQSAEDREALASAWQRVPRISIDYGIMEHAEDIAVMPVDFGWNDVGDWASLLEILPADENGNVVHGQAVLVETSGSLVHSGSRLVAVLGIEDLIIVDTADVLLICPKNRAQDVRAVVDRVRSQRHAEFL